MTRINMESRLILSTLLCGLVLVACVALTDCHPVPLNMVENIKKLKEIHLKNLTETERQVDGTIFKEQLQKMDAQFGKEEQRLLVLEMLDVYSHLFKQMSKEADRQGSHEAKNLLHYIKRLDEYPVIKKDNDQLKMLRDIRDRVTDYKWSPAEQLKALNDFQAVYQKATELAQSKSNLHSHPSIRSIQVVYQKATELAQSKSNLHSHPSIRSTPSNPSTVSGNSNMTPRRMCTV